MIIKDTDTLRKHLSVNPSFTIESAKPSLRKAERNFLKPLIGAAQIAFFEAYQDNDTVIKEAIELAQEAVANFGFYLYMPIGSVQITDGGFYNAVPGETQVITDKQFKELQRSFKTAGHEALDDLLNHMEENASSFTLWTTSVLYSVYKELLVRDAKTFNEYFYIFKSRQTFLAMRPNIKVVEDQFIKGPIGSNLLSALKSDQTVEERKDVKELLQQSIVAFTVMKTVDNGMFVLDAQGIHMRFDALPYESTVTNINLKVNDLFIHTKKNKESEGQEYLKAALKTIKANPLIFPEYSEPEVKTVSSIKVTPGLIGT